LNSNAEDYKRYKSGTDELRWRKSNIQQMDKALIEAKEKLLAHLSELQENQESVQMINLLR
jgi:hypothetical protein